MIQQNIINKTLIVNLHKSIELIREIRNEVSTRNMLELLCREMLDKDPSYTNAFKAFRHRFLKEAYDKFGTYPETSKRTGTSESTIKSSIKGYKTRYGDYELPEKK